MPDLSIEHLIEVLGYLGIFTLMATNGVFSFPSSQILYIICGYLIFSGNLALSLVIITGALGNTLGNYILYLLTRRYGLTYITKLTLIPLREIQKAEIVFRKRGTWFLFIGKLLPALKVFMPIIAGITRMNQFLYLIIILITSAIWASVFIAIGYYFGKETEVFGVYAVILFIVAFVAISVFYKYMNSKVVLDELIDVTEDESPESSTVQKEERRD